MYTCWSRLTEQVSIRLRYIVVRPLTKQLWGLLKWKFHWSDVSGWVGPAAQVAMDVNFLVVDFGHRRQ